MKLSIITINYNNLQGLRNTFQSVISQTWQEFEWIVIDGGSTDGGKELLEEHQEKFSYWVSEPDKGIYNAMNKGISHANGEYLIFLNSGDIFSSENILELAVPFINTEEIIYGDYCDRNPNNSYYLPSQDSLSIYFWLTATICHQSTFIKRTLFDKGGYREGFSIVSDWERFFLWYMQHKTFKHIDIAISINEPNGISNIQTQKREFERDQVISELTNSYPREFSNEIIRLTKALNDYSNFEHQEVDRILKVGHFQKRILYRFLLFLKKIDIIYRKYFLK